ncbi:MAG TPA: hypothetical protein VMG34_02280 [Bacteroidota bacterium]|nr:hypothetical protein [Bacteroidota bacterium]
MLTFVLVWITVSIAVSIFASWIEIVPRYTKRVHKILVHLIDTAILTVVLTALLLTGIYPHWTVVFLLIFLSLALSVWFTNRISRGSEKNEPHPDE